MQSARAGSRRQGTQVRFHLRIAKGRIADVGYDVFGSPYAIASCSLAAEWLVGRSTTPDSVPRGRELAEALDFPVDRTGVALIVEDAIRGALGMR